MRPAAALLLVGVVLLGGCIMLPVPHDQAVSPLFYGQVKDQSTGLPVKNATASVSVYLRASSGEGLGWTTATAQTDENGYFQVGAVQHQTWFSVLLIGPAEGHCAGTLIVAHPEFQQQFVDAGQLRGANINGPCTGFKVKSDVLLQRRK